MDLCVAFIESSRRKCHLYKYFGEYYFAKHKGRLVSFMQRVVKTNTRVAQAQKEQKLLIPFRFLVYLGTNLYWHTILGLSLF